jgi:CDP-diacylglycerol--serine O-phosphatidyltransferase
MISSIRYRSFRSLISPKSRKPYALIGFTAALAVGFVLDPAITGCVVAYSYLAIPVLLPARLAVPIG